MEKDSYEDINEEDIAALEDNPAESELESAIIVEEGTQTIPPDTPIYRLRLPYSNEIFFATYRGYDLGQVPAIARRNQHHTSCFEGFALIRREKALVGIGKPQAIDRRVGRDRLGSLLNNDGALKLTFSGIVLKQKKINFYIADIQRFIKQQKLKKVAK